MLYTFLLKKQFLYRYLRDKVYGYRDAPSNYCQGFVLLGPEWCRVKSWKLMQEEPSSTDNMAEAEQH